MDRIGNESNLSSGNSLFRIIFAGSCKLRLSNRKRFIVGHKSRFFLCLFVLQPERRILKYGPAVFGIPDSLKIIFYLAQDAGFEGRGSAVIRVIYQYIPVITEIFFIVVSKKIVKGISSTQKEKLIVNQQIFIMHSSIESPWTDQGGNVVKTDFYIGMRSYGIQCRVPMHMNQAVQPIHQYFHIHASIRCFQETGEDITKAASFSDIKG